ncbi:MAG: DUF481 domain-containing protein [Colwellia sp.]|nr:DUF481 domain-containing protein [Colwellia sp.]
MNKFLLLTLSLLPLVFLTSSAAVVNSTQGIKPWKKPTPVFDQKFDWLRLTSDEWLKGDIISMYDDELEFDSEEFDLKTFDWQDVAELRSRFDQSIRLTDGSVIEGFLIVKNQKVTILSNGQAHEFPLSELLTITSSSESRGNLWDGNVKLGANYLKGNVGQTDYTLSSVIQRRTPESRFRSDFIYSYSRLTNKGEGDDVVNTNSRRLTSYFDWFYTAKVFFRLLDFEHFSDELQNIKSRNTIGLAVGYHLINNKRVQWDITLGPSYQQTIYLETQAQDHEQSGVASLSTFLEYEVSSVIDLVFDYQIQFVNEASGKRIHNLKTGISFDLKNDVDVDVSFYIDRIASPLPTDTTINSIPEENDYRLVFSFGYSF